MQGSSPVEWLCCGTARWNMFNSNEALNTCCTVVKLQLEQEVLRWPQITWSVLILYFIIYFSGTKSYAVLEAIDIDQQHTNMSIELAESQKRCPCRLKWTGFDLTPCNTLQIPFLFFLKSIIFYSSISMLPKKSPAKNLKFSYKRLSPVHRTVYFAAGWKYFLTYYSSTT